MSNETTSSRAAYVPSYAAKQAQSFVAAHINWKRKCEELRAAEISGDAARIAVAVTKWERGLRSMPSKARKAHAYSYARQLNDYLSEEHSLVIQRAETVEDIAATVRLFKQAIAKMS